MVDVEGGSQPMSVGVTINILVIVICLCNYVRPSRSLQCDTLRLAVVCYIH